MSSDRISSFEEFWPYYVREHQHGATRALHFAGTTAAVSCLAAAALLRKPLLVPLAVVVGYGPSWVGHFFVEKNRPATFKYPLWSLLADFKMWRKIATGQMSAEVERAVKQSAPVDVPTNGVHHSSAQPN